MNESTRIVVTPLKFAGVSDGDVVGEGIIPNPTSVRLTIQRAFENPYDFDPPFIEGAETFRRAGNDSEPAELALQIRRDDVEGGVTHALNSCDSTTSLKCGTANCRAHSAHLDPLHAFIHLVSTKHETDFENEF